MRRQGRLTGASTNSSPIHGKPVHDRWYHDRLRNLYHAGQLSVLLEQRVYETCVLHCVVAGSLAAVKRDRRRQHAPRYKGYLRSR
jgi:hypothetical protein